MEMADFHAVGRFFPDEGAALDVLEKKIRSSVCCGQICADDSAGFRAAAGRVEFGIQQNAGRNLRNRGGEIRLGGFKVEQKLCAPIHMTSSEKYCRTKSKSFCQKRRKHSLLRLIASDSIFFIGLSPLLLNDLARLTLRG